MRTIAVQDIYAPLAAGTSGVAHAPLDNLKLGADAGDQVTSK